MFRDLSWRSFRKGSRTYIDAFLKTLRPNQHVHLNSPVKSVLRQDDETVSLIYGEGVMQTFDHVVLAVHANQALDMLGSGARFLEKDILSKSKTTRNIYVLHSDELLMPRKPAAYASWNIFMETSSYSAKAEDRLLPPSPINSRAKGYKDQVIQKMSITFDMNRLQGVPRPGEPGSPGRVLLIINPIHFAKAIKGSFVYHHPLFTPESFKALRSLYLINGIFQIHIPGA